MTIAIELTTSHLREAVAAASRVIQRSTVEVMECVVLSCGDDQMVRVLGSSAHGDIQVETGDNYHGKFSIAVNAERFKAMVDRATSEKIKLKIDDASVAINGGTVRGRLNLLDASHYPPATAPTGEALFDVEIDVAEALGKIMWASGVGGHLKPFMQGPNIMASKPGAIEVACTTGAVMARWMPEIDDKVERDFFVTISMASSKMLAQTFKVAGVKAYSNRIIVEAAGFRMGVPLLMQGEGRPFKELAIAASNELRVNRTDLLAAVRACGAASDIGKMSMVKIVREGDVLHVTAHGKHGDVEETVDIESGSGQLDANFWVPQLSGALSASDADAVTIDGSSPIRLQSGGAWQALIMPLKV